MSLRWDAYTDQPDIIRDKKYKRRIYRSVIWDFIKMLLVNLFLFPIIFIYYLIIPTKKNTIYTNNFFGIGININKNPDETRLLIDDLDINNLIIRMPLHDIENIQKYVEFSENYANRNILINILQDHRHVENLFLLKQSLDKIFALFSPSTLHFQIGNAVNRKKWAIFSMDEYLKVYKVAYKLKKEKYPHLILLGSSIIDFEYYFTMRTLFNFTSIHYDQLSSLLYVDRRGAPENKQLGLNMINKLHLLSTMVHLSPKIKKDIVITEFNWPLQNTYPYAPTSSAECVSLEEQANYLVRYYLLAIASGVVKNVYWHQLIAPGYGLIDNREKKLIKYPSYYAFKTMLFLLQKTKFVKLKQKDSLYQAIFEGKNIINVYWALNPISIATKEKKIILRDGKKIEKMSIIVHESPVYILNKIRK